MHVKSKLSRRRFIATVATGSLAAQLPVKVGAAEAPATPAPAAPTLPSAITSDTLAAGEKLAGISFSPAQREPLIKMVADRIAGYAALRTPPIPNEVFPALTFNLAIAGVRPPPGAIQRLGAVCFDEDGAPRLR